jgi:hypothetical protein
MPQSGCLRRTLSAAVTPATPLPRTTTRLTAESNAKIKVFEASLAARSGLDSIVTGPWTFAQHAMRVEAAKPSRSSVARSSFVGVDRLSMPAFTQIGSAPHTPIRQPDSIFRSEPSIISSSDWPGLATILSPLSPNVISIESAWACLIVFIARAPKRTAPGSRIRSRKTASLPHVRHTNSRASDHTSPRNTQIDQWFASLSSVAASVGDAYQ